MCGWGKGWSGDWSGWRDRKAGVYECLGGEYYGMDILVDRGARRAVRVCVSGERDRVEMGMNRRGEWQVFVDVWRKT